MPYKLPAAQAAQKAGFCPFFYLSGETMRPQKTIAGIVALLALSLFSGGCHNLFDDTPARFVAVGMMGDACWSVDGSAWACATLADTQLNSVACSPDTCIAVDKEGVGGGLISMSLQGVHRAPVLS